MQTWLNQLISNILLHKNQLIDFQSKSNLLISIWRKHWSLMVSRRSREKNIRLKTQGTKYLMLLKYLCENIMFYIFSKVSSNTTLLSILLHWISEKEPVQQKSSCCNRNFNVITCCVVRLLHKNASLSSSFIYKLYSNELLSSNCKTLKEGRCCVRKVILTSLFLNSRFIQLFNSLRQ